MTSARVASDIMKANLLTDAAGEPLLGFDLTFFIGWFLFIPLLRALVPGSGPKGVDNSS